jgi:hypothetical protein
MVAQAFRLSEIKKEFVKKGETELLDVFLWIATQTSFARNDVISVF